MKWLGRRRGVFGATVVSGNKGLDFRARYLGDVLRIVIRTYYLKSSNIVHSQEAPRRKLHYERDVEPFKRNAIVR